MKINIQISLWLLAAVILLNVKGYAQNGFTEEMAQIINATEKHDIFSIAETVKFDGQVIRADEIVFGPDSELEFTNLDYEWIAIVADKIKFTAPLKKATIKRSFEVFASNGGRGTKGGDGGNGKTSGRHGSAGNPGGTGEKGGKGGTEQLPRIFIITKQVTSQESEQAPDYINLKLIFPGIDGGNGGTGGTGGKGGTGGHGRDGSDGVIDCKSGAGDGGRGGAAGQGGQGGDGGDGGNGADIVFIGSDQALEVLTYSIIINTGGDGGIPGVPGSAGTPGGGGNRGNSSTYCGWGKYGSEGSIPNPPDLGYGKEGNDGAKGKVEKYLLEDHIALALNFIN